MYSITGANRSNMQKLYSTTAQVLQTAGTGVMNVTNGARDAIQQELARWLHHWRRYCGHCKQESTPPLEQVLRLYKSLNEARAGAMYSITTLYTVTTKSSSVPGPTVDRRRVSVNSGAAGKEATTYVLTCVS